MRPAQAPNRSRRRLGERGAMALELAILAPVLLALVGLIVVGGRYALANTAISGVAGAAAREASLARNPGSARSVASSTARATLAGQNLHCQGSPTISVDTSGFFAPAGRSASITVDVTCVVLVNGLAIPGLPRTRTLHDRAVSPLDPYRSSR